MKRKTY